MFEGLADGRVVQMLDVEGFERDPPGLALLPPDEERVHFVGDDEEGDDGAAGVGRGHPRRRRRILGEEDDGARREECREEAPRVVDRVQELRLVGPQAERQRPLQGQEEEDLRGV